MAIDAALLESYIRGKSGPTIRFYSWKEPTVSLGRFQKRWGHSCGHEQSIVKYVRRPSGGKAVFHTLGELTYAVVAGARESFPEDVTQTYKKITGAWFKALGTLGIRTSVPQAKRSAKREDLCFLHRLAPDMCWNGKKIMGSAQRRERNAFLQHGSLIVRRNNQEEFLTMNDAKMDMVEIERYFEETAALNEITAVNEAQVMKAFLVAASEAWECRIIEGQMSSDELAIAHDFLDNRYFEIPHINGTLTLSLN